MFGKNKDITVNGWVLGYTEGKLVQVFVMDKKLKEPKMVLSYLKKRKGVWNFTDDTEFYPIAMSVSIGKTVYTAVKNEFIGEASPYLD